MGRAIVVMGKLPRPGRVKTRLGAVIGAEAAAALYAAFLADVFAGVERAAAALGEVRLVFSAALAAGEALEQARALAPPRFFVLAQRSGGLGERIRGAYLDAGAEEVLILGSDAPHLPPERIVQGFAALAPGRCVFGPSEDGGYYLVALAEDAPRLFEDVAWSTARVLAQSKQRAAEAGLSPVELAPWWDVDEIAELSRLRRALALAPGAAPATWAALQRLPG